MSEKKDGEKKDGEFRHVRGSARSLLGAGIGGVAGAVLLIGGGQALSRLTGN